MPLLHPHRSAKVRLLGQLGVIIVGGCLLEACGDGSVATSMGEVRSPNGRWLATAVSQSWGGPGNAYDATSVYLQRGSGPKMEVVGLINQFSGMHVSMTWLTPTHLEVAYRPRVPGDSISVGLQVVRIGGEVDISLRQLTFPSPTQ